MLPHLPAVHLAIFYITCNNWHMPSPALGRWRCDHVYRTQETSSSMPKQITISRWQLTSAFLKKQDGLLSRDGYQDTQDLQGSGRRRNTFSSIYHSHQGCRLFVAARCQMLPARWPLSAVSCDVGEEVAKRNGMLRELLKAAKKQQHLIKTVISIQPLFLL